MVEDSELSIEMERDQFDGQVKDWLLDPSTVTDLLYMLLHSKSSPSDLEKKLLVRFARYYIFDLIKDMIENEEIFSS